MSEKDVWLFRITDMLARIDKISAYVEELSFERFKLDEMRVEAIERNIEIIGEAARNVPEDIKKKHSEIPWRDIIGMRNRLSHDYGGTNIESLWNVATEDIHQLRELLADMYEKYKEEDS